MKMYKSSYNNKYKMKIIQAYAPTSAYDGEVVVKFYEDIEAAVELHKTQYFFLIGDINAKVGKKSVGMTAQGNFGMVIRKN